MMYEMGDVITLSNNNNYVVVTTLEYNGKKYIYLVNENDNSDVMFCNYQGEEFEKETDNEVVEQLLQIILPEMSQIIDEAGIME